MCEGSPRGHSPGVVADPCRQRIKPEGAPMPGSGHHGRAFTQHGLPPVSVRLQSNVDTLVVTPPGLSDSNLSLTPVVPYE